VFVFGYDLKGFAAWTGTPKEAIFRGGTADV
jgi:hypothetical protein